MTDIVVTGPGGVRVTFPEGTPTETINSVMAENFAARQPAPARAPAEARNPIEAARYAITGENRREPGVREFHVPSLNVINPADLLTRAIMAPNEANVQSGFFLDSNPRSREEILRRNFPDAEFQDDRFGNRMIRREGGEWQYIDRPGLSVNDAQSFVNEGTRLAAASIPAGWFRTLIPRMLAAGGTGAALEGASQEAARVTGGRGAQPGDVAVAGVGTLFGQTVGDALALAEPFARNTTAQAMRAIGKLFPDRPSVQAAPVSRETVEGAIDTAPVGQSIREGLDEAARSAEAGAREATARLNTGGERAQKFYELADEFGVQGVRQGQATGSMEQIATEQRALRGGSGERAYEIMRESEDDVLRGLHDAGRNLPTREGQERVSTDLGEAGRELQRSLTERRDVMSRARDMMYDEAEDPLRAVPIRPGEPEQLITALQEALRREGIMGPGQMAPEASVYPVTARALNLLSRRMEAGVPAAGAEGPPQLSTLFDWEAARKGLNALRGNAQGLDRDGIGNVGRVFDDWYERQALDSAEALQAIRAARAQHRDIIQTFEQRNPGDIGGRAMERLMNLEQSGADVIDGVLGARPGSVASALSAVRRIKDAVLTTDAERAAFMRGEAMPPEIASLREAIFYRIMRPVDDLFARETDSLTRPATIPAQTLDTNMRHALEGDGKEIMRELFTEAELAKIGRFREFVQMLQSPPGSVNFSGTAYEGARMVRGAASQMAQNMFGRIGFVASVPFQLLENVYTRVFNANLARRALGREFPINLRGQERPVSVGTGVAGAQAFAGEPAQ